MVNPYKYVTLENGKNQVEHRVIMEEHLGIKLSPDEVVHHINGDYRDNRIENLQVMPRSQHSSHHHAIAETEIIICAYCGKSVVKYSREMRKKRQQGTINFYCNKSCAGQHKSLISKSPQSRAFNSTIREIVIEGLAKGLSGYKISKEYKLNRKTVYNHIKQIDQ